MVKRRFVKAKFVKAKFVKANFTEKSKYDRSETSPAYVMTVKFFWLFEIPEKMKKKIKNLTME